jgi:hypothetical protein
MKNKVKTDNVEIGENNGEFGQCYTFTCPECFDAVEYMQYRYMCNICRCGYTWTVELVAKGEKQS